ncbi:2-dehydropantoate 2-reductase [Sulfuritalea sp.]|uniref:2-dehydropantoate 2-reductase n=1 Tax=Sulfuritalea sp. TaxID=2480090 RepID=UPI001AC0C951|nr:2-dehydropantoate 2-reductase [Sulfuritalea sp.]MBN8475310.1 2-dehydropantoate 2-reductase [Sulfuritalea sp.]
MKICIVGAGAIGGMIAARLAHVGHEVTVIVRGANLEAVRRNGGMKLIWEDGTEILGPVRATDSPAEAGIQDCVILALKAHQLRPLLGQMPALLAEHTSIVTMQNGIPFWYFHRHGGEYEGRTVESVDPGGELVAALGVARIIGSIVYPASELIAPGVVRHIEGNRFTLGEPDGSDSERIRAIAGAMRDAGFKAPISNDIRSEIWLKLWGNVIFNPVSALTHATLEDICRFPLTRDLAAKVMAEAQAIGEKLGVKFKVSIDKRIAGAESIGAHKTSMLQDVEAGRALELDALVGSVVEMGRITGLPTPHIDAVYACAKLLDKTLQDAKGRLQLG